MLLPSLLLLQNPCLTILCGLYCVTPSGALFSESSNCQMSCHSFSVSRHVIQDIKRSRNLEMLVFGLPSGCDIKTFRYDVRVCVMHVLASKHVNRCYFTLKDYSLILWQ